MKSKVARWGLIAFFLLGLMATSELLGPSNAYAQIGKVRMGVNGMI